MHVQCEGNGDTESAMDAVEAMHADARVCRAREGCGRRGAMMNVACAKVADIASNGGRTGNSSNAGNVSNAGVVDYVGCDGSVGNAHNAGFTSGARTMGDAGLRGLNCWYLLCG